MEENRPAPLEVDTALEPEPSKLEPLGGAPKPTFVPDFQPSYVPDLKPSFKPTPKPEPKVENAIALTSGRLPYGYHAPSPGPGNWQVASRRPMPVDMFSNLEALGGPRERVPLTYCGDPERALSKLHQDVVSSYRMLCNSLGEAERTDLTEPTPYSGGSLLSLPMANMGGRPSTFPSSSSSLLKGFPIHGRRAIGAPPSHGQQPYCAALDELRGYASNLGGVPHPLGGYDQYNQLGGSRVNRAMPFGGAGGYNHQPVLGLPPGMPELYGVRGAGAPQMEQQYIPGYSNSLIPSISKPGAGGVRVSSISTYDQGNILDGGLKGESQLLYPPVGSTFEGQPAKSYVAPRGRGIDTLEDFKYHKRAPLMAEVLDTDFVSQAPVKIKSERDQLDSFLSDYVEAGVKPQLPSTSALMRPERGRGMY